MIDLQKEFSKYFSNKTHRQQRLNGELENNSGDINDLVLIVDGMNLFIRCYCAVPAMNDDGDHVGGVVGFIKSITSAIKLFRPSRCIVVWDGVGGSQSRRKIYPEYKNNRKTTTRLNRTYEFYSEEEEKESKKYQLQVLVTLLNHLPVSVISREGVEADDIIAWISNLISIRNGKSIIFSTDKDFLQLVSSSVRVWNSATKKLFGMDEVISSYQVHPVNFAIYRALLGDASDNIPGVTGIGPKFIQTHLIEILQKDIPVSIEDLIQLSEKTQIEEDAKKKKDRRKRTMAMLLGYVDVLTRNLNLMELKTFDKIGASSKLKVQEFVDNPDSVNQMNKLGLINELRLHKLLGLFSSDMDDMINRVYLPLTRFCK